MHPKFWSCRSGDRSIRLDSSAKCAVLIWRRINYIYNIINNVGFEANGYFRLNRLASVVIPSVAYVCNMQCIIIFKPRRYIRIVCVYPPISCPLSSCPSVCAVRCGVCVCLQCPPQATLTYKTNNCSNSIHYTHIPIFGRGLAFGSVGSRRRLYRLCLLAPI